MPLPRETTTQNLKECAQDNEPAAADVLVVACCACCRRSSCRTQAESINTAQFISSTPRTRTRNNPPRHPKANQNYPRDILELITYCSTLAHRRPYRALILLLALPHFLRPLLSIFFGPGIDQLALPPPPRKTHPRSEQKIDQTFMTCVWVVCFSCTAAAAIAITSIRGGDARIRECSPLIQARDIYMDK